MHLCVQFWPLFKWVLVFLWLKKVNVNHSDPVWSNKWKVHLITICKQAVSCMWLQMCLPSPRDNTTVTETAPLTHPALTQGVRLAVFIRNCENANHFMALLAEVCVHFLSKQALANQGQLQLILVVNLWKRSSNVKTPDKTVVFIVLSPMLKCETLSVYKPWQILF